MKGRIRASTGKSTFKIVMVSLIWSVRGAQRGGISAHRSQHKTGGEVARMEVLVDGVLGNYYIAVGRGI